MEYGYPANGEKIDASGLLYMPIPKLQEFMLNVEAGSIGVRSLLPILQHLGVSLVCGMVCPEGATSQAAIQRGVDLLSVYEDWAQLLLAD